MKMKIFGYAMMMLVALLFVQKGQSQVTDVDYQIRYNTQTCRWDCYIICKGTATTALQRTQSSAQFSIVVPAGLNPQVTVAQNFMPLQNNQTYTGTVPLQWQKSSVVSAPTVTPDVDYIGFTPNTVPTAFYNNISNNDTIRIFSLNIPTTVCGSQIRLFRNNIDPPSSAPGMGGGNFSNGFTIGGTAQKYRNNQPNVFPPRPVLSSVTGCSSGVEIDLTATTSTCQSPMTYSWTGPNGFTTTTQDVNINPATSQNSGDYFVTVTDSRGCTSTRTVTAVSKPSAGPDQNGCPGANLTLNGINPNTGTWTSLASNPSGATLGTTTNGSASVSFDLSAANTYRFIYTTGLCSDTAAINMVVANAGPDPSPITCFSTGTATMAASGSGVWSLGAGSAGTLNIANTSNPNTNVSGFSGPGTYFLKWTVNGCEDIAQIVVGDNCSCAINNNVINALDPSAFCGSSGVQNLTGGSPAPAGGNYIWQYSLNNAAFANASPPFNQQSYSTTNLSVGSHRFRRIYELQGQLVCFDTSNVITITVNTTPNAPSNLLALPNPTCLGTSVNLSVTNTPSAIYTWTASSVNAGLNNTTSSNNAMLPSAAGTYTISVTQSVNNCVSPPATVEVVVSSVPPTPTLASVSGTNPTSCGGSQGAISFSGLANNTMYTLSYSKNSTNLSASITSNGSGIAVLSGQTAGSYANFRLTNTAGCASGTYAGPITLTDPNSPAAPTGLQATPNPTCANVSIAFSVNNTVGATYSWTTLSPELGLVSSTTNTTTALPTASGFYNVNVTQTIAGCTSNPATLGISINPTPPTPTAANVSRTNPTTCGGNNGTITISNLNINTSYNIEYKFNNNTVTTSILTNGSGNLIINNLSAGNYTDFKISNVSGCSSGVYAGPVVLTNPSSPSAPANLTATPNPACSGTTINLSVTNVPGNVYSWTASSTNAGLVTSGNASTTMLPLVAGTYTISVTQSLAGCISPISTVTVVVNQTPPTPTVSTVGKTDPLTCGASNGTITFSGLLNNTSYTINYSKDNQPATVNVTSNSSGVATITGLTTGSYSNFTIISTTNCASGEYTGSISLLNPISPNAPLNLIANPNPVCVGSTINLSVTNVAGATYNWSASSPNAGLVTSTINTTTMTPLTAGSFTISVTQNFTGECPSLPISITVNSITKPATPTNATVIGTNPTSCGGNNGSISISNLTANETFTIEYTFNNNPVSLNLTSNASGVIVINNLISGSYTAFKVTNSSNCASEIYNGPVSLSDPGSPPAPANLVANPNPSCLGTLVNLSVTNNPNATYNWTSSSPSAGLTNATTSSTNMTATAPGVYIINVVQNVAGCTSPTASVSVTVNNVPPSLNSNNVLGTNPNVCGGSNGQISLINLGVNTSYSLSYSKNNVPVNTTINSNGSGTAVISNLTSGSYTNFLLTVAGGCQSNLFAGPINLTDPNAPPAPTGLTANPNPVCFGRTVNLSVNNNVGVTFTWTASSAQAGLVSSITNLTSLTPTSPGNYTISVTQTVAGCVSPAATIDVLINALPPTPTIGNITSANPTVCTGSDGSIRISGLLANTPYTIDYSKNNVPTSVNITTNAQGAATINNLTAGSYANFVITNGAGCSSGAFNGPVVLTEPGSPSAPLNFVANPNPSCLSTVVNLSVANNANAVYNWSTINPNAGLNTSSTSNTTMLATASGSYIIQVSQTINGCTSPFATLTVNVADLPPTPSQTSVNNPTCNNSDGSITISGLGVNTNYIVKYNFNNIPAQSNKTTNGNGSLTLTDLQAGSYSNFRLENSAGCSSNIFAGPVSVFSPGLPPAPSAIIADPDQICLRSNVSLNVQPIPGATFNWTASGVGVGLLNSNNASATLMPTQAGTYTISVTQTVAGCTSSPSTIQLEVKGDCLNPDINATFVNVATSGDVSTNDSSTSPVSYSNITAVAGNPSPCLPILQANGTYTFVCNTVGKFQFLVSVCDQVQTNICSNVPLLITVIEPYISNNPPIVNHDYIRTKMNTPIGIMILENDKCQSIPNCNLTTPTVVLNPINGTFDINTMVYTPKNGYIGLDSMRYRICQSPTVTPKNCEEAWVYIAVLSNNSKNVTNAMDDYNQTSINTPLIVNAAKGVKANDSDIEGHIQLVNPMSLTMPGQGHILLNEDGSYVFTPANNYSGPVACPYELCDNGPEEACDKATIHILVEPLNPTGSIGDQVWQDFNADGLQNNNEPGIPGIIVELYNNSGTKIKTTSTNSLGKYIFTNVLAGRYYVKFSIPSEYSITFSNPSSDALNNDINNQFGIGTTRKFDLAPGEQITYIDAGVYQCAKIGDHVFYDTNKNDVFDPNENGTNGIKVNLWRLHFGNWLVWDYQYTKDTPGSPSDEGYYEFCVPPGQYYIEVIMPAIGVVRARPNVGNNEEVDSDLTNQNGFLTSDQFTVVSGQSKLDLGAGFYPEAIAGNLVWVDENTNGIQEDFEERIAGVKVEAVEVATGIVTSTTETNASGFYSLEGLEKQSYYLRFTPPPGFVATYANNASDDKDSDVDHSYGLNTTRAFNMEPSMVNDQIDMGLALGVLPVDWVNVSAKRMEDYNLIEWATAKETNLSHYEIERKVNTDPEFKSLGIIIKPNVNQNNFNYYSQKDIDADQFGVYYYRVKQVDVDGQFTYSNIVKVAVEKEIDVKMYPVPSKKETTLDIALSQSNDLKIELFDASSKLVKTVAPTHAADEGNHTYQIQLQDLKVGLYTVVITIGTQVISKKLIRIE